MFVQRTLRESQFFDRQLNAAEGLFYTIVRQHMRGQTYELETEEDIDIPTTDSAKTRYLLDLLETAGLVECKRFYHTINFKGDDYEPYDDKFRIVTTPTEKGLGIYRREENDRKKSRP